jgi:hypothetical protein
MSVDGQRQTSHPHEQRTLVAMLRKWLCVARVVQSQHHACHIDSATVSATDSPTPTQTTHRSCFLTQSDVLCCRRELLIAQQHKRLRKQTPHTRELALLVAESTSQSPVFWPQPTSPPAPHASHLRLHINMNAQRNCFATQASRHNLSEGRKGLRCSDHSLMLGLGQLTAPSASITTHAPTAPIMMPACLVVTEEACDHRVFQALFKCEPSRGMHSRTPGGK